jgi:hypothetical protein
MRRTRIWIGLSALYVVLLLGIALVYLLDAELTTDEKLVTTIGISALPAVAFALVAVPLLRGSRNRAALIGGAVVALGAASLQLMLTWGVALPVSAVLIVLAFVATNRATAISGVRRSRRVVLLGVLLAALVAVPMLTLGVETLIGVLVAAGVACLVAAARARSAT